MEGAFDIFDSHAGVPAIVHMHGERAQAPLHSHIRKVDAVDSAAYADDAVVFFSLACFFDLLDHGGQFRIAVGALVGVEVCAFEVLGAEVATAFGIKGDIDVVGIHHTAGTDAERSVGHREEADGFKKLTNLRTNGICLTGG